MVLEHDEGGAEGGVRAPALDAARLIELADGLRNRMDRLRREVGKVIVGQDQVIGEILIAFLAGGHVILEGVPGLAKTLLVNTVASALSLTSGRIQFTPDLMPSDVTGTQVIIQDPVTRHRRFSFQHGPVFVNMLLADEINRTPPKTQAALLEAMGERHVTVGGRRYRLPDPFFVLATQNPIEQEGTFRLPEAQLDRFLLKIHVDYPTLREEEAVVRRTTGTERASVAPVLSHEELLGLQRLTLALRTPPHIVEYATRLARASRPGEEGALPWTPRLLAWGAGPRAGQALLMAAKARTLIEGRFAVTRADVRAAALPVLRHRILPSFRAEGEGLTADALVARLVADVPPYRLEGDYDRSTRRFLPG